ncbi:DUF2264 domain-containing protein [Planctomonas sp. JC2975]|uniref:DUF2264 domain-containing protein n=1 Tax=Planctomonas sp. JC2975 TaxID=2729626 RepID=UPI00197BF445
MTLLSLPPEDRALSPYTGWTREHWAAVADHLLLSLRPFFSPTGSRVALEGRTSANGADSDGFEGFARSLLLYAFRSAGENGRDPLGFTPWYRDGLLAGTDPANPERWPLPGESDQAKVEAASIALALQLTRPWIWDTYTADEQRRIIDWLAQSPIGWYPDNNWLWFRLTVETFLASVGGPHDLDRVTHDLATIESYYRADGWYADGSVRAFDYYCGWAMHVYPLLWTAAEGSAELGGRTLDPVFRGRLSEFLDDYVHLIGADGVPVIQGRSLIYRFATAAPLWMGAVSGATTIAPGLIRRAASGVLKAFVERGSITPDGLLTLGFFGEWPDMAQNYSGPGSPYWASKGMLGLLLPADHPVWQAVEEPLPVEVADTRTVIRPAGWILSGTRDDGIVRLFNHGADHAAKGDGAGDSPLYARFGYSTATIPPLIGVAIDDPADNSAGVLDAAGRSSHRTGFDRGLIGDDGIAACATSVTHAHWVDSSGDTSPDHGSGRQGVVVPGPDLQTASVVRGSWEVRAVRVAPLDADAPADRSGADTSRADAFAAAPVAIRISGWPLSSPTPAAAEVSALHARVEADRLVAELVALTAGGRPSVHEESGTSPLGEHVSVPRLEFDDVAPGETVIVASRLGRGESQAPSARVVRSGAGDELEVTWPDGALTTVLLAAARAV